MLTPFGPDIWLADGAQPVAVAGFRYPTRMAIIRLADGGLFVWSPVALTEALRNAVAALGPVAHIVAPNTLHDLHIAAWKQAFPAARLHGLPALIKARKTIAFDAEIADAPAREWAESVDQVIVTGNLIATETVFFHKPSGTVLFTDLIQQFPKGWFTGWRAVIARLDLMVTPQPTVPRKFRAAFTNRRAARAALRRILAWPCRKLVMAHGTPVEAEGRAAIAHAFRWLIR